MSRPSARDLLVQVVGPALADSIPVDADLRASGIGSGELIRLSLLIEEMADRALDEDELLAVGTVQDIQDILDAGAAGGSASGGSA